MRNETFFPELEAFDRLSKEEKAEILALMRELLSKREDASLVSEDNTLQVDKH